MGVEKVIQASSRARGVPVHRQDHVACLEAALRGRASSDHLL